MHGGWDTERPRWEEATRAAQSVQDIGHAMAYLEDWIALDYAPGSDVGNPIWFIHRQICDPFVQIKRLCVLLHTMLGHHAATALRLTHPSTACTCEPLCLEMLHC